MGTMLKAKGISCNIRRETSFFFQIRRNKIYAVRHCDKVNGDTHVNKFCWNLILKNRKNILVILTLLAYRATIVAPKYLMQESKMKI